MPRDKETTLILRARTEQLASEKTEFIESRGGVEYVRFAVSNNEFYGISYQYVKEVLHNIKPTKLPRTPSFIVGVINWRGALIPIVDLKQMLHRERTEEVDFEYGIIVRAMEMTIGMLVDEIIGSDTYQPLSLGIPLASVRAANPEYILGIHQCITGIINVETIISAARYEMEKQIHPTE